ncbi:MAG TPA: hypothetical protein VLB01_02315 [Thermodesulfobacteriota bacterium]|nr:hypothetical protein [Thermodesulfobacteriota bacterium]
MEKREHMRVIELNFLSELFVLCGDDTSRVYNIYEIGSRCGCSMTETKLITEELSGLDLLTKYEGSFHEVSITPKGIQLMKGEMAVRYRDFIY